MKKMLFTMLAIITAVAFTACGEPKKELTKQEKYIIIGKSQQKSCMLMEELWPAIYEGRWKGETIQKELSKNLPAEVITAFEKKTGRKLSEIEGLNIQTSDAEMREEFTVYLCKKEGLTEDFVRKALSDKIERMEIQMETERYLKGSK